MQWRVCLKWPRGAAGPSNVEIVDYYGGALHKSRPAIHAEELTDSDILELASGQFWLNLQSGYDILSVEKRGTLGPLGDSAWAVGRAWDYIWRGPSVRL